MLKSISSRFFRKENYIVFLLILLLILLAYGLLIPWLGFYWDDWPFAWIYRFFGPAEFVEAFRPFRPYLGPIFAATTTLFGGQPATWQIVGLLTRYLLSIELWFVLKLVWPSQKWNLIWVVLLFTVFPGYQQQWVSLTHVNQELIPLLGLIASFGVTAWAIRNSRYRIILTTIALALQMFGLFTTEYFFGLEIMRLFFIYFILSEHIQVFKDKLSKVIQNWLPYMVIWLLNAAWVYSYHRSAAYHSYSINIGSIQSFSFLTLVNEILSTISLSGFLSWVNTFQIITFMDGSFSQVLALLILFISAMVVYFLMQNLYKSDFRANEKKDDSWGFQALFLGMVAIVAGRLPSWAAGLPLKLVFDYDRFFLSIMLGACLFIIGMVTIFAKDGKRKIIILSILIGLATAYQFSVANTFRRDSDNQKAFFWQLAWRIPALKKGTVLITDELPLVYVSDMQLTAPINWMYASSISNRDLPYMLMYIKNRLNSPALPSLQANTPIQAEYRTARFVSSTSNSIVIFKNAAGCMRVLDDVYGTAETVPGANYLLSDAIHLSDPGLIDTNVADLTLDPVFFGKEPRHDWCYFYEKAELARQQTNWQQVLDVFDQAKKTGLSASQPDENLPFIEAYAMSGQVDQAFILTNRMVKAQKDLCPAVSKLWSRVLQKSPQVLTALAVSERLSQSGCEKQR
ncbi:MAG: hypothetical protein WCK35_13750 [Chloroflexota bacterium]